MDRIKEREMYNQMADYYDQYRPKYPSELIRTIITKANLVSGSKLLEIGAGSGKATEQFADYGFEILCIEPGEALVKKGNMKFGSERIKFVASCFEDYIAPSEYFDAIISAQAFHWVPQPIGYEKCARALTKDGYLAVFWNIDITSDNDLDHDLSTIELKYGAVSCVPEKNYGKRMESISLGMVESGLFLKPETMHFCWEKTYAVDDYFGYLLTGHVFLQKSDEEKKKCYQELNLLAKKHNGIFQRRYTCELYLTKKR